MTKDEWKWCGIYLVGVCFIGYLWVTAMIGMRDYLGRLPWITNASSSNSCSSP